MKRLLNTYAAYSTGCAVVWGLILALIALKAGRNTIHAYLLVFAGWVIGWLSATMARAVYPPPRR